MDYAKIVDYAPKDALATGNPAKLIKGTELGAEFDSIAVMSATKVDKNGALGTPSSGTLTNCTGTAAGLTAGGNALLAGSASQAFSASTLNGAPIKHHNDIRNGSFRVAQRGTSFAATATGAYDLDGWLNINASAAVFTSAQAAGSSTGKLCRTVTVTTADASVAAGDAVNQNTKIEGYNAVKYLGNTFTLGFRVKSAVTGVHCVAFYNFTSTYVAEYTINVANTWEYKTITVTGGTPVVGSTTSGTGLIIRWSNMAGTTSQTTAGSWNAGNFECTANQVNDMATNGNVFALEDVTMNLGTVAAVDEMSYEDELRRCQRYFETVNFADMGPINQYSPSATNIYHSYPFAVSKRAAPTYTLQSGSYTVAGVATSATVDATTQNYLRLNVTTSAAGFYQAFGNTGGCVLAFSADL